MSDKIIDKYADFLSEKFPIFNWNFLTGFGILYASVGLPFLLVALIFIYSVGESKNGNLVIPPTIPNMIIVSLGKIPTFASLCFVVMGGATLSCGIIGHILFLLAGGKNKD